LLINIRKIFNILNHAREASQYYTEIFHTPVTMSIIRKQRKTNAFEDVGGKEPKYYVIGNVDKYHAYTFAGDFYKYHC
jgi:hypothetical protein